jgi:hypothetical protein
MTHESRLYRVEWRTEFSTGWNLVGYYGSHGGARRGAARAREQFNGRTRIIVEHVIEGWPSPHAARQSPDMVPDE